MRAHYRRRTRQVCGVCAKQPVTPAPDRDDRGLTPGDGASGRKRSRVELEKGNRSVPATDPRSTTSAFSICCFDEAGAVPRTKIPSDHCGADPLRSGMRPRAAHCSASCSQRARSILLATVCARSKQRLARSRYSLTPPVAVSARATLIVARQRLRGQIEKRSYPLPRESRPPKVPKSEPKQSSTCQHDSIRGRTLARSAARATAARAGRSTEPVAKQCLPAARFLPGNGGGLTFRYRHDRTREWSRRTCRAGIVWTRCRGLPRSSLIGSDATPPQTRRRVHLLSVDNPNFNCPKLRNTLSYSATRTLLRDQGL
jgi:hypothetical protein